MNHPEYEFQYWGRPVKVYSGQEWRDFALNLTTFVVEWRRFRRQKFAFWMRFSNEMLTDTEYNIGAILKEEFIAAHRDLYAKLFNSIRNLKGNRRRGRRSIHKRRFNTHRP